ncbi:peptide deformylase [Deinococcus sonorensis]|uniref:Peptide deformylase n=2 Tax=Deinococcus sonorensis TaxID=309891 RepID=A0AAU7UG29_9DEIO
MTQPAPHIYPIRLYGDPVLRRKARPIQDVQAPVQVPGFAPAPLKRVADRMLETMFEARGVGLAAPQIGLSARMFVAVEYEDDEDEGDEAPLKSRVLRSYVMLNPTLSVLNKRQDDHYQEGCLSIPGIYEEGVKRRRAVRVDYTDLDGQPRSIEAEDYLARVFQHEIDHLDGVFFLDHLPAAVTDEHRKALGQMQRHARAYLRELEQRGPDDV